MTNKLHGIGSVHRLVYPPIRILIPAFSSVSEAFSDTSIGIGTSLFSSAVTEEMHMNKDEKSSYFQNLLLQNDQIFSLYGIVKMLPRVQRSVGHLWDI